jgi:hypothetical protein
LEELTKEFREVLVLHFLEQQTMTRIAAVKGLSQPTISRRVTEALQLLRENLRQRGVAVGLVPLQVLLTHSTELMPQALLRRLGKMTMAKAACAKGASNSVSLPFNALTGNSLSIGLAVAVAVLLTWLQIHQTANAPQSLRASSLFAAPNTTERSITSEPQMESTVLPVPDDPMDAVRQPTPRVPTKSARVLPKVPPVTSQPNSSTPAQVANPGEEAAPPSAVAEVMNEQPQAVDLVPFDPVPWSIPAAQSQPAATPRVIPLGDYWQSFNAGPSVSIGYAGPQAQTRVFERDGAGLSFGRAMPGPWRPIPPSSTGPNGRPIRSR